MKVRWIEKDFWYNGEEQMTKGKLYEVTKSTDTSYIVKDNEGNDICFWKRRFKPITTPTISLNLEGIEEGQKFNLYSNGMCLIYSPYHVKNNKLFDKFGRDRYDRLIEMLNGEYTIELIDTEEEEKQKEIAELEATVKKALEQIEELKKC